MTRSTFFAVSLAVGGLVVATLTTRAQSPSSTARLAEQPAPHLLAGQAPGKAMPDTQMMGMHQKMMAEMKTMDVALDALITKMNTATGTAKVDAIAEALTTMVRQHKTMRDGMMQMHSQMMMQMHGSMTMPMGAGK